MQFCFAIDFDIFRPTAIHKNTRCIVSCHAKRGKTSLTQRQLTSGKQRGNFRRAVADRGRCKRVHLPNMAVFEGYGNRCFVCCFHLNVINARLLAANDEVASRLYILNEGSCIIRLDDSGIAHNYFSDRRFRQMQTRRLASALFHADLAADFAVFQMNGIRTAALNEQIVVNRDIFQRNVAII